MCYNKTNDTPRLRDNAGQYQLQASEVFMRRATTPTHTFTLPDEVRVETVEKAEVVYSQNGNNILKKGLSDLSINETTNSLYFTLTQNESNLFAPQKALVQVRIKVSNGAVMASQMIWLTIKPVLDSEVM